MKYKEITFYELIGLMKDGKAPKKIKINNIEYEFVNGSYYRYGAAVYFKNDLLFEKIALNDAVEIIEENDEWEEIPIFKISDYKETFNQFQLDIVKQINLIKKNQKYLKERLDKDEK